MLVYINFNYVRELYCAINKSQFRTLHTSVQFLINFLGWSYKSIFLFYLIYNFQALQGRMEEKTETSEKFREADRIQKMMLYFLKE
jgi:hypothetical protein